MIHFILTKLLSLSLVQWVTLLAAAVLGLSFYIKNKFNRYPGIVGVKPHWFFGNSNTGEVGFNDHYHSFYEKTEGHRFAIFWDGWIPAVFLRDLELVKTVQIKEFESFTDFGFQPVEYERRAGNQFGLADMKGEEWRKTKRLVTPPFSIPRLKKSTGKIHENTERMIKHLKIEGKNGGTVDLGDATKKFCMNIVGNVGFGLDIDCFQNAANEFKLKADTLFNTTKLIIVSIFPVVAGLLRLSLFNMESFKYFMKVTKNMVAQRNQMKTEAKDVLGNLIKVSQENPNTLSEDMLFLTVIQFFTDGYLTASDTISTILYLISHHSEVQEKIQEEVDSLFADKEDSSELTEEDTRKLPYLDQVSEHNSKYKNGFFHERDSDTIKSQIAHLNP